MMEKRDSAESAIQMSIIIQADTKADICDAPKRRTFTELA